MQQNIFHSTFPWPKLLNQSFPTVHLPRFALLSQKWCLETFQRSGQWIVPCLDGTWTMRTTCWGEKFWLSKMVLGPSDLQLRSFFTSKPGMQLQVNIAEHPTLHNNNWLHTTLTHHIKPLGFICLNYVDVDPFVILFHGVKIVDLPTLRLRGVWQFALGRPSPGCCVPLCWMSFKVIETLLLMQLGHNRHHTTTTRQENGVVFDHNHGALGPGTYINPHYIFVYRYHILY